MSRNYKFLNPDGVYFVSFAVVNWLDVFIRKEYKLLIIDSLHYCQQNKSMEIFAWCIMSSHVHLIFRSTGEQRPELLLGDFKRFTSKALVKAIIENPAESRKDFLLEHFLEAGDKTSNVERYQFWRHDNHPIELWSSKVIDEKINYIHNNPVEEGYVFNPEDYLFSSAVDYAGGQGLLNSVIVVK